MVDFAETFAFTVDTFDSEHMLQISDKLEALVTVSLPSGPAEITEFCVYDGAGTDDNGDETEQLMNFGGVTPDNIKERWIDVVKYAYRIALDKASDKLRKAE